jgi:hypothetical protein
MNNYEMTEIDTGPEESGYEEMPQSMAESADASASISTASAMVSSDMSFAMMAAHMEDNLAAATLRLVDATRDFTGLIKTYVEAGKELERSLQMVKELASSSQAALDEARRAAADAAASAGEAKQSQQSSVDLIQRATKEHMALADLTDNLRMRISALAVLGAPLSRDEEPGKAADKDYEAA